MNFTKRTAMRLGFTLALAWPLSPGAPRVMPVVTHDANFNEPARAHSARFKVRTAKFWRTTAVAISAATASGSASGNPPVTVG
jgi:hypothetical protein